MSDNDQDVREDINSVEPQADGQSLGPLEPVEAEDRALSAIAAAGVILVAVGGILAPLSATTRCTAGSTVSAKIQWEVRDAEIIRAFEAQQTTADEPTTDRQSTNEH